MDGDAHMAQHVLLRAGIPEGDILKLDFAVADALGGFPLQFLFGMDLYEIQKGVHLMHQLQKIDEVPEEVAQGVGETVGSGDIHGEIADSNGAHEHLVGHVGVHQGNLQLGIGAGGAVQGAAELPVMLYKASDLLHTAPDFIQD